MFFQIFFQKWNKARYTAIPVADGWAGVEMRVFTLFNSCSRTDRPTDRRTDKGSYRVACPQLKTVENKAVEIMKAVENIKTVENIKQR